MSQTLQASIQLAASPEQVWAVVSDLRRMPEFSPQCVRMIPLGQPKVGTFTLNLNRDGKLFWPTTSRITSYEPGKAIAFRMNENRTVWSFELTESAGGTLLTQTRTPSAHGIPGAIRLTLKLVFKGEPAFDALLTDGMNTTLARIKAAVEG